MAKQTQELNEASIRLHLGAVVKLFAHNFPS